MRLTRYDEGYSAVKRICEKKRMCIAKNAAICLLLLLVFMAAGLCGCSGGDDSGQITSYEELNAAGTIIGVSTDTPEASKVPDDFPDATIESYSDITPAYQEVSNGKIDAAFYARITMEIAMENGVSGVTLLEDNYCLNPVAVGISRKSKIDNLQDKINEFLQELRDDGTLDDMYERWAENKDYTMPDIPEAEDPDITLYVATTGTAEPFTFYEGTELTGYDIELAKRFAYWLGAGLEFKVYDWGGLLTAAQSGDSDCIMSNMYHQEEYEESIDFSDDLFEQEITAMVRDESASSDESLWSQIKSGFIKTFITEDRWQLFVNGACTTLEITLISVLLGTLLGFLVFMACRHGSRIAIRITDFTVWLVDGMPVVVLLMILYYIIFGSVSISGTIVAIMAFTLIFASAVYERMKTGTSAVSKGQTKAAFALGYTERQAFYKVVLPQAMPYIIPSFKGDITSLLKGTAVVGYIAVQDLTKMADIVRSRTYDAFFPLIAAALIYFILEALFKFIVNGFEKRHDPKRRRREDILKGVQRK